jgi:iron complex outermembrane receptor protein
MKDHNMCHIIEDSANIDKAFDGTLGGTAMSCAAIRSSFMGLVVTTGSLTVQLPIAAFGAEVAAPVIEEVVVTARKREERLQDVPDVVTAFSADVIQTAQIQRMADYMNMTPNVQFRDGTDFQSGFNFMSVRGISNGNEGWPSVAVLVDGVRSTSLTEIDSGQLADIGGIEVVHGPQGSLYGAGAIAGAVNIITKAPTDAFEGRVQARYGSGDDRQGSLMLSGALVPGKLRYRFNALYRDSDGLIDSGSNDLDLDSQRLSQYGLRLTFQPIESLSFDLRGELIEERNGATYQAKYPLGPELGDPDVDPHRAFPGVDNRDIADYALKIQWDLGAASVISTSGWSDVENHNFSSACWDDPNDPQVVVSSTPGFIVGCLFNPFLGAFGDAAQAGQPIDQYFSGQGDYESVSSDLRLVSNGTGAFRWLIGAEYMERENPLGFDTGVILAPDRTLISVFPEFNLRQDALWGLYAHFSYRWREAWEFTVGGRYDDTKSENTAYTDGTFTTPIPVPIDGVPTDTEVKNASKFQPKVQVAYHLNEDLMTYATYARGFQAGFFSAGQYSAPQETENYELGFKSTLRSGSIVLNGAVFHIDYSEQQFSTVLSTPPFLQVINIPDTDIDGAELEFNWNVYAGLAIGTTIGYLDTEVSGTGLPSPGTPDWTGNLSVSFAPTVGANLGLNLRADYRYHGALILDRAGLWPVGPENFLNLRAGIGTERWTFDVYGKNVLDTREFTIEPGFLAGGLIPGRNKPASYGAEFTFNFR